MSSPRFEPWLIPETISSGRSPSSPSSAKRTQSTGVPSVAKPLVPSSKRTSSTHSGERVVMLRAVALRLEAGGETAVTEFGGEPVRGGYPPIAGLALSGRERLEAFRRGQAVPPPLFHL